MTALQIILMMTMGGYILIVLAWSMRVEKRLDDLEKRK
jgi:hypothetical protein